MPKLAARRFVNVLRPSIVWVVVRSTKFFTAELVPPYSIASGVASEMMGLGPVDDESGAVAPTLWMVPGTPPVTLLPDTVWIMESVTQPTHADVSESAPVAVSA